MQDRQNITMGAAVKIADALDMPLSNLPNRLGPGSVLKSGGDSREDHTLQPYPRFPVERGPGPLWELRGKDGGTITTRLAW